MKRKLIRQKGSYTVTLPIDWVNEKRLKPGDELDINIENGKVVMDSKTNPALSIIEIEVKDMPSLRSLIGIAYKTGFQKIVVNLPKEITVPQLQKILNHFTGLEIEKFGPTKVSLRCIISGDMEDYSFFVRKMFLNTKLMIDEIINFFQGNKFNFDTIQELRKNNINSREYCMRIINLNKIGKKGSCDEYAFLQNFEKISSSFWHMGQYLSNHRVKKSDKTKELLLFIKEKIDILYHAYLKKEPMLGIKEILPHRYSLNKEWFIGNKMLNMSKNVDPIILSLILSVRRYLSSATNRYYSSVIAEQT